MTRTQPVDSCMMIARTKRCYQKLGLVGMVSRYSSLPMWRQTLQGQLCDCIVAPCLALTMLF